MTEYEKLSLRAQARIAGLLQAILSAGVADEGPTIQRIADTEEVARETAILIDRIARAVAR